MPYLHEHATGASIATAQALLTQSVEDADTITISVEAAVASSFALDVDFGDGNWVQGWQTWSAVSSIGENVTLAADRIRIRNTAGQTSGDTADVHVGAV